MRKKKIVFSDEELEEAENGYTKEIPEQELPYYQNIIINLKLLRECLKKKAGQLQNNGPIKINNYIEKF